MGNPVTVVLELDAADANGIAEAQTLAGAGNVDLDGILVSDGVAVLTSAGIARQVIITSAGDDTGVTFTIYGTNPTGNAISEQLAGASAGAATSAKYYRSITRIAADGATDGDIEVGTNGVGVTRTINIDTALNPTNVRVECVADGTVNYTLEVTAEDIQNDPTWTDDANIDDETATQVTTLTSPYTGVRTRLNSGTGSVTTTMLQAGLGS